MAGRIPVMTCSFSRSFGSARAAGLDVSDDQFLTPLKNRCACLLIMACRAWN